MNLRRGMWLGLAAVLLALGAWLMFSGQGDEPTVEAPKVEFPRKMKREDWQRAEQRRTQVMPAVAPAVGKKPEQPKPRDPVLAALPRGQGHSAVVIEANALRYSPIGELLLDCLMRDGGKNLEDFRRQSGVDPLQDLDRMVITDKGVVLSGNFGNAKFKEMFQERVATDYGPGARVYEPGTVVVTTADGGVRKGRSNGTVGTWNDQLLVVGEDPAAVKEVLDQVNGGGSSEEPVINEKNTYGEMYGVLSVDQLARMIPPDQAELAEKLRDVAQTVELHMDARSDVAMVAQIRGSDSSKVTDLGKSLGGALSLARLKAQTDGNKDLAQLLEFARVEPDGKEFKLELAVPLEVIKERLAFCRDDKAVPGAQGAGAQP